MTRIRAMSLVLLGASLSGAGAAPAAGPARGPLRACPENQRYFATPEGRPVYLAAEHPVTRRQRAYVRRVVATVQDLDNVLFEIANESHTASLDWQNRMVDFIRECERGQARQHPIGITVPFGGARRPGLNRELLNSRTDWISPNRESGGGFNYRDNPPPARGRKVVLGFGRVCVHLPDGFSYDAWKRGLDAGRSFVTTGPMLLAQVNGRDVGAVFQAKPGEYSTSSPATTG